MKIIYCKSYTVIILKNYFILTLLCVLYCTLLLLMNINIIFSINYQFYNFYTSTKYSIISLYFNFNKILKNIKKGYIFHVIFMVKFSLHTLKYIPKILTLAEF